MNMYEVMAIQSGRLALVARFRELTDALRFVDREGLLRSLAIRTPFGGWYEDSHGRMILGRR